MSEDNTAKDQLVPLEVNISFTLCLSVYTRSKRKYWRCLCWFCIEDTLHAFLPTAVTGLCAVETGHSAMEKQRLCADVQGWKNSNITSEDEGKRE